MTSPARELPAPAKTDWSSLPAILYIWIPASLLAFLMGSVPYCTGYGFSRIPMTLMMRELWKIPDWEHCFLVPLAIGFILFEMRDKLALLKPKPSAWGWPLLAIGIFVFWAGQRVDNQYIGYAAMQGLVGAWIVLLLGWRFMIQLAFPWMFLIFLWPLLFLETYLAFPLRLIMSEASVVVLNMLGIASEKVGTSIISSPDAAAGLAAGARFQVDVADPCSGIRSLFALMMVSAVYGFLTFKEWWKHALLFLASIPLAILGNLVRMLILTIGVLLFGAEFAIGEGIEDPSTYHMVAGFFVFGVALGGMLLMSWILNFDFRFLISHWKKTPSLQPAGADSGESTLSEPNKDPSKKRQDDLY